MMSGGWTVDWNAIGGAMLATGIRGALLLSAVAGVALLLKGGSAARRHLVWALGMAGLLALPVLQLGAPNWRVEVTGLPWMERSGALDDAGAAVPTAPAPDRVGDRALPVTEAPSARQVPGTGLGVEVGQAAPVADDRIAGAVGESGEASLDWAFLLLGIWASGALLLGGAVAASHLALRRLERSARPCGGDRVAGELPRLAVLMGIGRPVRLLEGGDGQMPMSWGLFRPTILLPRGADRWPGARLRSVLLHELAHVRRRDCLIQLVAELACALHWPNPLAWVAVWRLRVEREHACDDRVLEAGAEATVYAEELLSLARGFRVGRRGSLAAVAMVRPSNLESRLRAVLAEGRRRRLSRRGAAVTAAVAVLFTTAVAGLSAVPATPAFDGGVSAETRGDVAPETESRVAADPAARPVASASDAQSTPQALSCGTEPDDWQSSSHNRNDDRTRISWSRPGCDVEILLEGDVEFNDSFDDLARLGRGARLRIEETDGRTERWLEITPGSGGAPSYAYRVDRSERPFDAGARAWFEGMLLQLFRRAGFAAEERVAALLEAGGVAAVFQELELLSTDHVYARYVEETIRQADLSDDQLGDLLDQAMDRVDSDHYLSEILEAVASDTELNDRLLDSFISASRALDSDHYRAGVLTTALDRGDLSEAQVRGLLASASEIDSDHYLAEILEGVSDRYALQADLRDAYLQAVARIESDHYVAGVLSGLLERSDLDQGEKATVLRAAARIESDHYVTEVLEKLVERGLDTGPLRDAYFEVTAGIESDHYRHNALRAVLEHERELSERQLESLIAASAGIQSDHYRSQLLVEIADRHRLAGAARDAYVRAMESIESRHYRGPVAEALLRNGG
jgi:beta-lactamase regulating signal transducer with metallopeptidase domain